MNEKKALILIVEDDERLNNIHKYLLESEGYDVITAHALEEARILLVNNSPDLILLDVMLPDGRGFDFCREIRPTTSAHIIFLTAVTDPNSEMEGLEAGGDDYLRKPYGIELLCKRVEIGLRQKQKSKSDVRNLITRGSLTLEPASERAFIDGKDLSFSHKEFMLLLYLIENEGQVIAIEELYANIWKKESAGDDKNAIQVVVSRVRKKIERSGYGIFLKRGKGYSFEVI
jgi:DNA-binding response OmpR family regulator